MPKNATITVLTEAEYRICAASFHDNSYRQLAAYSDLAAKRTNSTNEFVGVHLDGKVVGVAAIRTKRLPVVPGGIAYILGGPLVRSADDDRAALSYMATVVEALKDKYVRQMHMVLRISNPPDGVTPDEDRSTVLRECGFRDTQGQYNTILVNLDRTEEELRKGFHQKWRNCLNRADKNEMDVVQGTNLELFDEFAPLLDDLKKKKDFRVDLGVDFFKDVQRNAADEEKFTVHLARINGEVVAGHIGSIAGDTSVYLLGAANEVGNKVSASYLLQWRFMLASKNNGCRWYDLGGIDKGGNPGVFRFKSRMGGEEVSTKVLECGSAVSFLVLSLAEKTYKMLKGK